MYTDENNYRSTCSFFTVNIIQKSLPSPPPPFQKNKEKKTLSFKSNQNRLPMLFFAIFQAILQDRKGAGWPNLLLLKPRGQHKMADIHTFLLWHSCKSSALKKKWCIPCCILYANPCTHVHLSPPPGFWQLTI